MGEVKLQKYNYSEFKPTGKQNCECWITDGSKITAYYHQLKQSFVGLYPPYQNVELLGVKNWRYAIVPKRHSNDLFPNMVDCLFLKDGLEVFRSDYGALDDTQQERLFRENELIEATIFNYFKVKYSTVTCHKCGKVETDYETSQATWQSTSYDKNTGTVLCECPECYGKS
jgi:hypothetical protein